MMVALLKAGFFRELRHGEPDGPSITEYRRSSADDDEANIAEYLDSGITLAATGIMVSDVLDDAREHVAPLEIATDGVWVWPRDLSYYVGNYHVALPEAFVAHMRAQSWAVPHLSPEDLRRVEDEYLTPKATDLGTGGHIGR